mmetsp:Transcript_11870/g.21477  ORF Transcript_11870/g.21477 Transcript_11870/m.21477 type:complete len:104 (-) Transcript_11870:113-424(-)
MVVFMSRGPNARKVLLGSARNLRSANAHNALVRRLLPLSLESAMVMVCVVLVSVCVADRIIGHKRLNAMIQKPGSSDAVDTSVHKVPVYLHDRRVHFGSFPTH